MDYAICLDQFSTNFDVNNLSSNGFSIYTNLDNYTTPIAQNIPYQDLFAPPIVANPPTTILPWLSRAMEFMEALVPIAVVVDPAVPKLVSNTPLLV